MTYYQIKSSRINMGGWVGKRYRSAKLVEARQSIQWQNEYPDHSTDPKARKHPPLIDKTSQTSLRGCGLHNTSAVNLA